MASDLISACSSPIELAESCRNTEKWLRFLRAFSQQNIPVCLCSTFQFRADKLSRNVGNWLPIYAAKRRFGGLVLTVILLTQTASCKTPSSKRPYTSDKFQTFVFFKFAFSNYTEPSPVSTDHYFCCFVLWTHTLHRQITLLVKEWNSGVMTIEFASIL